MKSLSVVQKERLSGKEMKGKALEATKAIDIEDEIGSKMEPDTLVTDPVGQTAHALCVTDCLIHTKSALDSIGVFLTDLMDLDAKDGNRDLKKRRFRKMLADKDPVLGHQIEKMRPWFKELQDIRDEWIHRSALRCKLIHGPSEVGLLPIPRNVMLDLEEQDKLPLTRKNFWSTGDFVQHHYSNLVTLFNTIIEGCIQIERKEVMEPIPIPSGIEKELWVFPIRLTKEMKPRKMTVKFPKTLRDW